MDPKSPESWDGLIWLIKEVGVPGGIGLSAVWGVLRALKSFALWAKPFVEEGFRSHIDFVNTAKNATLKNLEHAELHTEALNMLVQFKDTDQKRVKEALRVGCQLIRAYAAGTGKEQLVESHCAEMTRILEL